MPTQASVYLDSDTYSWLDQQPGSKSQVVRSALSLYRVTIRESSSTDIVSISRPRETFDDAEDALDDVIAETGFTREDLLLTDHTNAHFTFRFWEGLDPWEERLQ